MTETNQRNAASNEVSRDDREARSAGVPYDLEERELAVVKFDAFYYRDYSTFATHVDVELREWDVESKREIVTNYRAPIVDDGHNRVGVVRNPSGKPRNVIKVSFQPWRGSEPLGQPVSEKRRRGHYLSRAIAQTVGTSVIRNEFKNVRNVRPPASSVKPQTIRVVDAPEESQVDFRDFEYYDESEKAGYVYLWLNDDRNEHANARVVNGKAKIEVNQWDVYRVMFRVYENAGKRDEIGSAASQESRDGYYLDSAVGLTDVNERNSISDFGETSE